MRNYHRPYQPKLIALSNHLLTCQQMFTLTSTMLSHTTSCYDVTYHVIDTGDATPIKVPPCPIPFHYVDKVHNQLREMAQEGIIRPSNSPWCAPSVYVPKSNGKYCICIDFAQLNQMTKKDSYPVSQAEGPQLKLAGKRIFSKHDLRSAYWQFPMDDHSIEKTAFRPPMDSGSSP